MSESPTRQYAGLFTVLEQRLTAADFLTQYRQSAKDFTRQRCLPFVTVILFLLNLVKRSLQDELDEFFKLGSGAVVATRTVTKSAFTQARKKLKAEAFTDLNRVQVGYFYTPFSTRTWHGFRLLAIDGSTTRLPHTSDIEAHFGLWNGVPMARVSQMFDSLNKVTVDALIGPTAQGEREYAAQHLALVGPGDLVLLDRGYPAFWLFALIAHQQADCCARMPIGLWSVVDAFVASGQREQIVTLDPCVTALQECQSRDLPTDSLFVRLLRIELDSGEIEVLATSLLDPEIHPYEWFKELYHQRWPVEEDYTVLKMRVEVENGSGKSALSINQDFHAKVFTANLAAILAHPAQQVVTQQYQGRRHTYQIHFAHLLSKMKDTVVFLLQQMRVADILDGLWHIMLQTIKPVRPGRKYPRRKTGRLKGFSMAYKPLR